MFIYHLMAYYMKNMAIIYTIRKDKDVPLREYYFSKVLIGKAHLMNHCLQEITLTLNVYSCL